MQLKGTEVFSYHAQVKSIPETSCRVVKKFGAKIEVKSKREVVYNELMTFDYSIRDQLRVLLRFVQNACVDEKKKWLRCFTL